MSVLQPRHQWAASRISQTLGVDITAAKEFLREGENFGLFALLCAAEPHSPAKLYVLHQAPEEQDEEGEMVESAGPPQLFFGSGEEEVPLRGPCCFFRRVVPVSVDLTAHSDGALVSGVIDEAPLRGFQAALAQLMTPMLDAGKPWGKADPEFVAEFRAEVGRMVETLGDAQRSLTGLALQAPEPRFLRGDPRSRAAEGDEEMVLNFEALLVSWCDRIEGVLRDKDGAATANLGPRSEMDLWCNRQNVLGSVLTQLKTPEIQTVLQVMGTLAKNPKDCREETTKALRRWRQIDASITDAVNEAKDNVKFLGTLDKFMPAVYGDDVAAVVEIVPTLVNAVKMIHSVSRYFNTAKRQTSLLRKFCNQIIGCCASSIVGPTGTSDELWDRAPAATIAAIEEALHVRDELRDAYAAAKAVLELQPKGAQFDFSEVEVFGGLESFARRLGKLATIFGTVDQFLRLGQHTELEGIGAITTSFGAIMEGLRARRHNLMDHGATGFDRDAIAFEEAVAALEKKLQSFIDARFEAAPDVEESLSLLSKFRAVLSADHLKADLDSKYSVIFRLYSKRLEDVQELYERQKAAPPLGRDMPPVAGNIAFARHLLRRVEEPIKRFGENNPVLATGEGQRVVRSFNKMARTLVAFEYLWQEAWVKSLDQAKAGLQATLIIRHPDDGKLYVNFDKEILQLIREGKCLQRLGVALPEPALLVIQQEDKYKSYYNDMLYMLAEYDRVLAMVQPVTSGLLAPHFADMEAKLRPGMVTLSWNSLNIDAFKHHVHGGLLKLEELVANINDMAENRVERVMKSVGKTLLADLPTLESFTLASFIKRQAEHVKKVGRTLVGKNEQVQEAVQDLINLATSFPLTGSPQGPSAPRVRPKDIDALMKHYNSFMYHQLLLATKSSMNALKKRVKTRTGGSFLSLELPFFMVDVQLAVPDVRTSPSLDEVQRAINKASQMMLQMMKRLHDWGQQDWPPQDRTSFFERITKDIEITKVALLLTGSVQGLKNAVRDSLKQFTAYSWLWKEDKARSYQNFINRRPSLDAYEEELLRFTQVEFEINKIRAFENIGPLSLNTRNLKLQLMHEASHWRVQYSEALHGKASRSLGGMLEYLRATTKRLSREVVDIDTLRYTMAVLKEVRDRESSVDGEITPVIEMYAMLERLEPPGAMSQEEMDTTAVLRRKWTKLFDLAEVKTDELGELQVGFRKKLLADVKAFAVDVAQFRHRFTTQGPSAPGISAAEAASRLRLAAEEAELLNRRMDIYQSGEALFALPRTQYVCSLLAITSAFSFFYLLTHSLTHLLLSFSHSLLHLLLTRYPDLVLTNKELTLLDKLYGLYGEVAKTTNEWRGVLWEEARESFDAMTEQVEAWGLRCRRMPSKLREWPAYAELGERIEDVATIVPLLQGLAKDSVQPRHWGELMKVMGVTFNVEGSEFRLETLLDSDIVKYQEEVEDITDGADKQMGIESKLGDIKELWAVMDFELTPWKGGGEKGVHILVGVPLVLEALDEAQLNLQTMLTMRHVTPFRQEATNKLKMLSETADILEQWSKVQMLWCALESVFTGGDIAKQMPLEARKFASVSKDWTAIMAKTKETRNVVLCCANELLKTHLPTMNSELQRCQKSLEGYLEQKRNKFPRFYFVSDPSLLLVLSQGSDPTTMNQHYEKVFDSVSQVEHDRADKTRILAMSAGELKVPLVKEVAAKGNIEEWLLEVVHSMQLTLKDIASKCAADIVLASDDIAKLRGFVDAYVPQFALTGIKLMWTTDTQRALDSCKTNKGIVKESSDKALAVLRELSSWCLQDLGAKHNRKKIETLVTVHVHQRDTSKELNDLFKARKLGSADDFEWLKQTRTYWRPEAADELGEGGALVISITDVDFNYQFEYLGAKECLVITPLTDRCYITLSQAYSMYFGGAPAGPAGTGKTETVKDLGCTLGIYVVVTNCTDQMKYTDCAKIFKGLCSGGLWGCFDEFNRISLPVLSVVAQQVLAVCTAKKTNSEFFYFPGDPQIILCKPICDFFITMNPGYAGRQELPENLKALFRGVAMMVPNREIIMKVKLCSVGYINFEKLAKKFFVLYGTSEQQLSKQKHYDFGLRNILSVLRTAGATKRANLDKPEEELMYQTLRDMNLSKLVAQDVPLFLSLLADIFPGVPSPAKGDYPAVQAALTRACEGAQLLLHGSWVAKVIQLYETSLVRHGIMLVGPAGGGKSAVIEMLRLAVTETTGTAHRAVRFNPKSVRAAELYGEVDALSGEWTTGVFAAIWAKCNNRKNAHNTWILADGPVDAIWIEDLNTVLDDNKILTLANGDRMPMTDNCKIIFEVESLANASPATVSRAGIIYVSDTDLDWTPVARAWCQRRPLASEREALDLLFCKWLGESDADDAGHLFVWMVRQAAPVMFQTRVAYVQSLTNLLTGVLGSMAAEAEGGGSGNGNGSSSLSADMLERAFLYCLTWSVGGLLDTEDRVKFDVFLRTLDTEGRMPGATGGGAKTAGAGASAGAGAGAADGAGGKKGGKKGKGKGAAAAAGAAPSAAKAKAAAAVDPASAGITIFDFQLAVEGGAATWQRWAAPAWHCPETEKLDFSNLLVPTLDSTRSIAVLAALHAQRCPVAIVGAPGTAKTSTCLMFFDGFDEDMLLSRNSYSSATTPGMAQGAIEAQLDKRSGKSFGPPNGKKMTVMLDDLSMPLVNDWGDQPTLELVRFLVENGGVYFLDSDKRGDFKVCEDLLYVGAMQQPGGGRNDIPNRLKRQFFMFNMVAPSIVSINDIYGNMIATRFASSKFTSSATATAGMLTAATIAVWDRMKAKMLPTPAKFHYVFNMRDLSRVFQGVLLCAKDTVLTGGAQVDAGLMAKVEPSAFFVALWRHECERVFGDKLTNNEDKGWFAGAIGAITKDTFGGELLERSPTFSMVSFLRDDIYDEDGAFVAEAPRVYEPGGSLDDLRKRVTHFMDKRNEATRGEKTNLILFDDALRHLSRISRLIDMPRGSGLLVGVGGSGKQSLAKLAAYICGASAFQITLTKQYNVSSLLDDLRELYRSAGHAGKPTCFIFTDSVIKDEAFLEYINTVLMTGELGGLFAKDEMMAITADITPAFKVERPHLAETADNLKRFFVERVRDNLHVMLCFSPVNALFSLRARRFPGLFSVPTIDWFLPWPAEALVSVARGFLGELDMECDGSTRENLIEHAGTVHALVVATCELYFAQARRHVYQTPKSFLSFLALYGTTYGAKLAEIRQKEFSINLGLKKLVEGAADVEDMKVVLAAEKVKLEAATKETNDMLVGLQASSLEAKKEGDAVAAIKAQCEADAERIAGEKSACMADLAVAQPFVDMANEAIASIKPAHIGEIKKLANPSDIIKLVFDGVLLLFQRGLRPVKMATLTVSKQEIKFIEPSFKPEAMAMMGDATFLKQLVAFGDTGKGKMNEETVELLMPYLELEGFTPAVAKNASAAAEGLCTYVGAMKEYYWAAKIVGPKLEALGEAEGNLEAANMALAAAELRFVSVKELLAKLQKQFEDQIAAKTKIEEGAAALARKMDQATNLIGGLSGEQARWSDDAASFAQTKRRLVGDCAVACAFISYLGPFNQEFREICVEERFIPDCEARHVPVTPHLNVVQFLVDAGTVSDWNMEGLPTDGLSIQNGILVTRSSRYPLLIDPQGQALMWIASREAERLPQFGTTTIAHPKLKDQLEYAMAEGAALVITGVEEAVDPLFEPVLDKRVIVKGRNMSIVLADKSCDFDAAFALYLITRLPNPHFSPELQAQTTVVDFTVTMKGLEEQLLGRVIGKEQKALEEQLNQVLEEVNANTKSLLALDASLLQRLTAGSGNLLDDEELVGVLRETKAKAQEVNEKLVAADATKTSINEKREQFRAAATRGSVLYFAIVEISHANPMYQISLDQFLGLFMASMDDAERASLASKRVANITRTMTYSTFRYVNRGLYECDKLTFLVITTLKILVTAGQLAGSDLGLLLRGGAALDINSVAPKPVKWMSDEAWLNVCEVSRTCHFFKELAAQIGSNGGAWQAWYEHVAPETLPVSGFEEALEAPGVADGAGPFYRLLLIRTLRLDRTILAARAFVRGTAEMGAAYVEAVTDTIDSIIDGMVRETPVIFLLCAGADPTDAITELARKRKVPIPAVVSLGEGQEPVATRAMEAAAAEGGWVLLQNCELGLGLMNDMEVLMGRLVAEGLEPSFRLFITALPSKEFPLGVLQMCTKVTNEPPAGLRACMSRWYTVVVTADRLDRVDTAQWRQLLFGICFLHSVVQERRKFGPLGWCIPYEYNTGDLNACIMFLEKHLYAGAISWPTLRFMVVEAIYGGKITDDLDRRLFGLFGDRWVSPVVCGERFSFAPAEPLVALPGGFGYVIPDSPEIDAYRGYIRQIPDVDSPELFGLHPNADLTFRVKEAGALLAIMATTQPKTAGATGGLSREEVAGAQAASLESKLPADYIEDEYRLAINRLGGLTEPLNICLLQEVQRLQAVIGKVRFMLQQLQLAIAGEVVMTEELQGALDAIFGATVRSCCCCCCCRLLLLVACCCCCRRRLLEPRADPRMP